MSVLPCLLAYLLFLFLRQKTTKKTISFFLLPPHVTKWNIVSSLLLSPPVLLCFRHLVLDAVALYFPYLFLSVLVVLLVTGYYFLVTLYFVFLFSICCVLCLNERLFCALYLIRIFFMTMIGLLGGCKLALLCRILS